MKGLIIALLFLIGLSMNSTLLAAEYVAKIETRNPSMSAVDTLGDFTFAYIADIDFDYKFTVNDVGKVLLEAVPSFASDIYDVKLFADTFAYTDVGKNSDESNSNLPLLNDNKYTQEIESALYRRSRDGLSCKLS